jgi:hypothetical protein
VDLGEVLVKVDEELQFSFSNEINSIARMHNVDDTLAPLTRPKASGKKKKKEHEMPTKGLEKKPNGERKKKPEMPMKGPK